MYHRRYRGWCRTIIGFFLILIMRDISRSNRYRQQLEVANKRAEDLLIAREN